MYAAVVTDDTMPEFDPMSLIDDFSGGIEPGAESEDRPLALHASVARILGRLCLWYQRGRDRGQRSDWPHLPFRDSATDPDFDQALRALYPEDHTPNLALWTPLFWYARLRVARSLPTERDAEWRQHSAARGVVESIDPVRGQIAGLPLIYLEAARLASTVVLGSPRRHPPHSETLDQLERIAVALLGSSLPGDHMAPKHGAALLEQTQCMRHGNTGTLAS